MWLVAVLVFLCFAAFGARRLLSYLHVFQQDEYDNGRFAHFLASTGAVDRRVSVALLLIGIAQIYLLPSDSELWIVEFLAAAAFAIAAIFETDPRRAAKKKLVMTARAKRIYGLALAALLLVAAAILALSSLALWLILAVQAAPFALIASNLFLAPAERRTQARFWNEAHEKLGRLNPTVIGITGSYGKTSVKHILGHILEMRATSLITPGSVNTAMGISRVIRENLNARHKYFIVEMGAYGPGSVQALCDLAPPRLGIITAIGKAHYERFKSLDNVVQAKFELAEASCRNGGQVVVASDVLAFAAAKAFADAHPGAVIACGEDGAQLAINSVRQTTSGLAMRITWQGQGYDLAAPLFGAHHARNIALAFAAACVLGMMPDDIIAGLRSVPQIAHRLEVKRQADGTTLIDDAYNSNPLGFAAALEILDMFRVGQGRRILVTPGMVELGAEHDAEHRRIGALAAKYADVMLAIVPERIEAFIAAYAAQAPGATIVRCATIADADKWIAANRKADDVVLLENDLPDLYERRLKF